LLREVYSKCISDKHVPNGKRADLVFIVHEWAAATPTNHARVCETLLGKLQAKYIQHVLLLLVGGGHAGKNKKDAIQMFIALDRPANYNYTSSNILLLLPLLCL
jgi:hypothetical protein